MRVFFILGLLAVLLVGATPSSAVADPPLPVIQEKRVPFNHRTARALAGVLARGVSADSRFRLGRARRRGPRRIDFRYHGRVQVSFGCTAWIVVEQERNGTLLARLVHERCRGSHDSF